MEPSGRRFVQKTEVQRDRHCPDISIIHPHTRSLQLLALARLEGRKVWGDGVGELIRNQIIHKKIIIRDPKTPCILSQWPPGACISGQVCFQVRLDGLGLPHLEVDLWTEQGMVGLPHCPGSLPPRSRLAPLGFCLLLALQF